MDLVVAFLLLLDQRGEASHHYLWQQEVLGILLGVDLNCYYLLLAHQPLVRTLMWVLGHHLWLVSHPCECEYEANHLWPVAVQEVPYHLWPEAVREAPPRETLPVVALPVVALAAAARTDPTPCPPMSLPGNSASQADDLSPPSELSELAWVQAEHHQKA